MVGIYSALIYCAIFFLQGGVGWEFTPLGFIEAEAPCKETGCEGNFAGQADHLRERFSYKEVQFKHFCLPVKTSCPPAENVTGN